MELLYLPDSKRNVQNILRLVNATHVHAMIIKINLRGKLKSLTSRKFFGVYYHSLIRHSSTQLRIVSGRTANTEKEEAFFNPIKTMTKLTSNNHTENVICNALIRVQASAKLGEGNIPEDHHDNMFESLYQTIKKTLTGK